MGDEPGLIAAILGHPAEDTPRLVYADFLDEFAPREDSRDRAAFVRAGVEYAQLPAVCGKHPSGVDSPLAADLRSPRFYRNHCRCRVCEPRRRAYYAARKWANVRWEPDVLRPAWEADELQCRRMGWMERMARTPSHVTAWSRGFVSEIVLPDPAPLGEMLASHPIEAATVGGVRVEVVLLTTGYWGARVLGAGGGFRTANLWESRADLVAGIGAWVGRVPPAPEVVR